MDTKEQKAKEYISFLHKETEVYLGRKCEPKDIEYHNGDLISAYITGWEDALKSQWISVKDRMPSEWQSVFILLIEKNDIKVTEAIYIGENGTWVYGDTLIPYNKNLLAWMPIPSFNKILEANKDVLMRLKDM